MRRALLLHTDFRCAAVDAIAGEATRTAGGLLTLRYLVTGRADDVALPPPAAPLRTDELWRHTCFEAFVGVPGAAGYLEFNFAPSSQWAAYRFDGYRDGMRQAEGVATPAIALTTTAVGFDLSVSLDLAGVRDLAGDAPWRVGLSAVIEERGGGVSYWALAHPPGKADFHHADCFALQLTATGTP